jgi:hypothetical protein
LPLPKSMEVVLMKHIRVRAETYTNSQISKEGIAMTSRKFSRKRIVQALGLLALGLVLLVGSAEYGQTQTQPQCSIYFGPSLITNDITKLMMTDASGRATVELWTGVFFSIPRGVQKRKLNGEHAPASNELALIGVTLRQQPVSLDNIESIGVAIGCSAAASATVGESVLQQQAPVFFVRLIKADGPKGFKVTTSGGRTTITSHHSGATAGTLWPMEVALREYKLKVGQTVRLAELKEKTAELYYEKLYSPIVRFNTKPEVAEAKVIPVRGPQGEPFGEIEFTAKAAGETNIAIDYEFYSHISTEYMGLARILVKVKVE